jgi:Uncharacterised nucleotidyltransferase
MSDYWECISLIGRIDTRDDELRRGAAILDTLDARTAYDLVLLSRVYTIARRNLERLPETHLLGMLRELEDTEERRRKEAAGEMRAVIARLPAVSARLIKGLPLRERYDRPDLRHEGDIDIQVPDWRTGRDLAIWLRSRGWQWDTMEFPWLKWTDEGNLYGQLTLTTPDNTAPVARVDLHMGPFSVGHAGLMPLLGWTDATVLGMPARVPDSETALALIAAHSLNDGHLSMKDVNDVHMLLSTGGALDRGSIEELCRSVHAAGALRQLLAETARCYPEHEPPSGRIPRVLHRSKETKQQRARRVARLTYLDERSRGRGRIEAASTAWEALRYYSTDLTPRVTRNGRSPLAPTPPYRRRDLCWRLLPAETWRSLGPPTPVSDRVIEEFIAPGLVLHRSSHAASVCLGDEVFVPTVWGNVHPQSLALAGSL